MTRRARAVLLACVLVAASSIGTSGYLKFGTASGSGGSTLRWVSQPARYFVTDRGVPGVSAADLDAALSRAFNTWHGVATADIRFERAGFTGVPPFEPDGISVIGFERRADLERTLGATTYTYDTRTGEILEADIFLNSNFDWSVAGGGEMGRFDVESIALHEIGHFLGLGHSAIGETELRAGGGRRVIGAEAVMFPIAFSAGTVLGRTLRADDVAGVSDIYPTASFRDTTGSVSGRVTKGGSGVFGAHIVAFNLATGAVVGGFSLSADGGFTIAGLAPGVTVLRAEPLDDGDVSSFVADDGQVDINFRVGYGARPLVVPAGGNVGGVVITVEPK